MSSKIEDLKELQKLYPKGCIAEVFISEDTVKLLKTEGGVLNEQHGQDKNNQ